MSSKEALQRVAAQLAAERDAARPVIAQLRSTLSTAWDRVVPQGWRRLGFVQELIAASRDLLEQDPGQSLSFAQFALAISTTIPREQYPAVALAQIEAAAWKEVGTAHRYLSEHDAALRAYDAARRSLAKYGALAHDQAIVDLATAVVYSELLRHDEALALIAHAAAVFASFDDQRRLIQGTLLKAIVQHRRGDLQAARITYEDALMAAQGTDDTHTLAAIYNNLAHVCIELNDTNKAAIVLSQAREAFAGIEMYTEVTRTLGAVARLLMRNGEFARAIPVLQQARREFLAKGMIDEAGVAALDLADAFIATDDRVAAQGLLETVLAEFRAARLDRALVAVQYLRDIVPTHPTPRNAIAYVRSHVEALRSDPARVFLPPRE